MTDKLERLVHAGWCPMLLILSSCGPMLYSTTGHMVPLFKNKGEIAVNAGSASAGFSEGFAVQAAAAIDSDWAVITALYHMKGDRDTEWTGDGTQFDLGAGKFYTFGEEKQGVIEIFAGIGFTGIRNQSGFERLDLNYIKPFIQPSIGFSGSWLDIALTPRIAHVTYTTQTITIDDSQIRADAERYFREKKNSLVFEPGVTLRMGYRGLRAQVQFNVSTFSAEGNPDGPDPNIDNEFMSIGLHYLYSKRFRQ